MGLGGFEPPTSPLSGVRSNQLSYRPDYQKSDSEAAYYTQAGYYYKRIERGSSMSNQITLAQRKNLEDLARGHSLALSSELLNLLRALGLSFVYSLDGSEVNLVDEVDLVEAERVKANISPEIVYEHHWVINSTNQHLMACRIRDETRVCTAEMQVSGRGRRGRSWVSPFGSNIYLSLLSQIERPVSELAGLSLAVGIRIANLLRDLGCSEIGLKWPNDLVTSDGKLGGILIESESVTSAVSRVCIGIGINVLRAPRHQDIGRVATCLGDYGQWDRTALIIDVIGALKSLVEKFGPDHMNEIQRDWSEFDIYRGKIVSVTQNAKVIQGVNEGIDLNGQLVLNCNEGLRYFNAGEVTIQVPESL